MPGKLSVTYPSAFDQTCGAQVTPEDILRFHRGVFGDLRMSNDDGALNGGDGGNGAGGEGGSGTGTGGSGSGDASDDGKFTDPDTGKVWDFPANTPTAEMTEPQRTEYWRHKAQKHEKIAGQRADYDTIRAERDQLKQATETDAEKAVREAREAGKTEARTEAANETVRALLRMGLRARGIDDDAELDEIVSTVNLAAYADEKGAVDDNKVLRTINRLAGTANSGGTGPDTGQGNRGTKTSRTGVAAGAELYAASRGKKTTTS
ncbi:MAG: hypothetical protein HOQ30_04350 [Gemmatimonadaceae bacterium]|nr:hypothetical protein [Streptomycetaceae bacterium]NUR33220.1 hypothetical protein [Gemmatimonadaceae bacterium]